MTAGSLPRRPAGAASSDWDRDIEEPGFVGSFLARMRPDEGWLSLIFVLVMAGTMAWSIADARWILGRNELTAFVIYIAILAGLWGYISSRLDIPSWLAHVIGAAIGAFVLIEVVGSLMPDAHPGLVGWLNATGNSVAQAYLDLSWRHQLSTTQYGHFCLVIGILVWGTAQAASYDVFGYHRAINGVLLMAVVLLANMAITENDQFIGLVIFSAAALAVLLEAHAADERSGWRRHRIWHGGDFRAPRASGGLGFASLAIGGALILTTVASSAPLQNAWPGIQDSLSGFANNISNYLPNGGRSRIPATADFGTTSNIGTSFSASNAVVFTVSAPDTPGNTHWRVIAYDSFRTNGWSISAGPAQTTVDPQAPLDAGTLDQVDANSAGRLPLTYTIHVKDKTLKHAILASEPGTADTPLTRILVGGSTPESNLVWLGSNASDYTITSFVADMDPTGVGLTQWRLQHAGTDFDAELLARYTQGTDLVGVYAKELLNQIQAWAKDRGTPMDPKTGGFVNEFDAAQAMQDYLRDPAHFTYNANIGSLVATQCTGMSTVDCFQVTKNGFCEQYATTMTMLMRMEGYPARYVEGYLAGKIDQFSRQQQVTGQQRHAWVEVYFPNYGWIPFDPTGGAVGLPTELPPGAAVAPTPSPKASSSPSVSPSAARPIASHPDNGGASGSTTDTGSGLLLPGLITVVVLIGLFVVVRRRPRRLDSPDAIYRSVVSLAGRLGYKPSPTQTVYEYTGMLADVVPRARDPLGQVATAKVEVAYGRRALTPERLVSLTEARRVVRQALLRLFFRLPTRKPKPGKPGARPKK
jgi:hypothetical protein